MIDSGASGVTGLGAFFAHLGVQEIATIGALIVSLVSLSLLWVLLRRRSKGTAVKPAAVSGVEPLDGGTQAVSEVAAAQRELRELVREFSALAEQVLRALNRDQVVARLPDAGGAVLQLLDLGLTPAEAARATGMSVGEVALLMNLRKAKASRLRPSETSPIGAEDSADRVTGAGGRNDGGQIEVNGE